METLEERETSEDSEDAGRTRDAVRLGRLAMGDGPRSSAILGPPLSAVRRLRSVACVFQVFPRLPSLAFFRRLLHGAFSVRLVLGNTPSRARLYRGVKPLLPQAGSSFLAFSLLPPGRARNSFTALSP